jgi:uncharacterized protein
VKRFALNGIEFEWDADKADLNKRIHGIRFETACEVFFDPFLIIEDAVREATELRHAVIGLSCNWQMLYVVHVERSERYRIISARLATSVERKRYENQ